MLDIKIYNERLAELYEKYQNRTDCYDVAEELAEEFVDSGKRYDIGVMTFCAKGNKLLNPLVVYDIDGKKHVYTHHTFLCVNKKVIDPMHGFPAMSMAKYISRIVMGQPMCSGIRIDRMLPVSELGMQLVYEALKTHICGEDIYEKHTGFDSLPHAVMHDLKELRELLEWILCFEDKKELDLSRIIMPIAMTGNTELLELIKEIL